MKLFTIGTNKKSAQVFFNILKENKIKGIIDIRLNNNSQLNGFSKSKDLKFFLNEFLKIDYIYKPELAPTKEILKKYKEKEINWDEYEKLFSKILKKRKVKENIQISAYNDYCFLCSELLPVKCHRRLVAEYLAEKKIEIIHL